MDGNEVVQIDYLETVDVIVDKCLPIQAAKSQKFSEVFQLAEGIKTLRVIFDREEIRETIFAMKDTRLGFLTDRSEKALAIARKNKKDLKPYHYNTLREACIEAMLNGYRLTGNEFNVIAGNFYATKNGKLRRINECSGVSDFEFTTTTPTYESDKVAKVQCWASWRMDGNEVRLGYNDNGKEDKLIFKIRVNKMMGEDAVVGKALSKLFSRVLIRLEGRITDANADEPGEDAIDVTPETPDADFDKLLNKKGYEMDQNESLVASIIRKNPKYLPQLIEDNCRYIPTVKKERPELYQMLITHWNYSFPSDPFPLESKRPPFRGSSSASSREMKKDDPNYSRENKAAQNGNGEADLWAEFRKSWIHVRAEDTLTQIIARYAETVKICKKEKPDLFAELLNKWEKVAGEKAFPIAPKPNSDEETEDERRERLRREAAEAEERETARKAAEEMAKERDEKADGEEKVTPIMDTVQEKAREDLRAWRASAPNAFDTVWAANGYLHNDKIKSLEIDECERLIEKVSAEFQRTAR